MYVIVYLTCLLHNKYHSAANVEAAYQLGYVYFEQRYRRGEAVVVCFTLFVG